MAPRAAVRRGPQGIHEVSEGNFCRLRGAVTVVGLWVKVHVTNHHNAMSLDLVGHVPSFARIIHRIPGRDFGTQARRTDIDSGRYQRSVPRARASNDTGQPGSHVAGPARWRSPVNRST